MRGMSFLSFVTYLYSKTVRRFRPAALYNCDIDKLAVVMPSSDCRFVAMGRYSYCGYSCNILDCNIGAFSSIADNVVIGGAEHNLDYVSTSPVFTIGKNVLGANFAQLPKPTVKSTSIGSDVWIGYGAVIKAGVMIGHGAVVAAGSVVTKDVAPYCVVAGVPARVVKKRFSEEVIEALLESRWWELSEEELIKAGETFRDPAEFLRELQRH